MRHAPVGASRRAHRFRDAALIAASGAVVAATALACGPAAPSDSASPPTASPTGTSASTGTSTSTAPPVAPTEASSPPAALPLKDPMTWRWDGAASITSDVPTSGSSLEDGDYFGELISVDTAARTVDVDIMILLTGDLADAWVQQNDPEDYADGVENGYRMINDVERVRTLPLADDARITMWCTGYDTEPMYEWALDEWAALPERGSITCDAPDQARNQYYWVDVRDGEVAQLVGQYFP
ncbi:hypothetical protein [Actinotalea subterranea]|uniref:hypothetical protein n=1 Tax=Actinotalea subterranea TaxID=2607497 RepID=UPI0011EFE510|nr:hypothetical protein [Actinotalea subterranea]